MTRVGNDRFLDVPCGWNQGVNGTDPRADDGHGGPDNSDCGHDGHDIIQTACVAGIIAGRGRRGPIALGIATIT